MKKILFTFLLVAGSLFMNAQSVGTVEFQIFNSGDTQYALASGHDIINACATERPAANGNAAITSIGSTFTYTLDSAGQLFRNGTPVGQPNARLVSTWESGVFYRLYTRGSSGFGNAVNLTDVEDGN